MIFEIMPTGLIIPIYNVDSTCAQPCFTSSGLIVFICALALYTINIYYTYVEYRKIQIYGFIKSFQKKITIINVSRIIVSHFT